MLGAMSQVAGTGDVGAQPSSPCFMDFMKFAGDSSYPTGGTASFSSLIKKFFGQTRTVLAVVHQDCGAYGCVYDPVNDKLKVTSGGSEVTNATNLSGTTFNVLVISY